MPVRSMLLAGVILALLLACSSTPESKGFSVQEYAQLVCGEEEDEPAADSTWAEFVTFWSDRLEATKGIQPPAELLDLHNVNNAILVEALKIAKDQPQNDTMNIYIVTADPKIHLLIQTRITFGMSCPEV